MRRLTLMTLALTALWGCSEAPPTDTADDFGYRGTGIGVTIAPLDLPTVSDACYSFEITNGNDDRVVARGGAQGGLTAGQGGDGGPADLSGTLADPLCSTRFGNSQGAISYVAPCDASTTPDGNELHTVRLWVNAVCASGSLVTDNCTPIAGFVNPCGSLGCAVTAACVENADVPVEFNFTIMASAQQGFFDIAVNFDNVFCSAKLDTCYGAGNYPADAIELLFDADGNRAQTAVAAVACSAGPGETTHLHMTAFEVTCGDDTYALSFDGIDAEGNITIPHTDGVSPGLRGGIYFGTEALSGQSKVYTNVAFVLPTTEGEEPVGIPCTVEWFVVPSSSLTPPQAADGTAGTFTQVAGVSFDPSLGGVVHGGCDQHPLNEDDSAVQTDYADDEVIDYDGTLVIDTTSFTGAEGGDVGPAPACTPEDEGVTMTFASGLAYYFEPDGSGGFVMPFDYIVSDPAWSQGSDTFLTIVSGTDGWEVAPAGEEAIAANDDLLGVWTLPSGETTEEVTVTCGDAGTLWCTSVTLGGALSGGPFYGTTIAGENNVFATIHGDPSPAGFQGVVVGFGPNPEDDTESGWVVSLPAPGPNDWQFFPGDLDHGLPESFLLNSGDVTYTVGVFPGACP